MSTKDCDGGRNYDTEYVDWKTKLSTGDEPDDDDVVKVKKTKTVMKTGLTSII